MTEREKLIELIKTGGKLITERTRTEIKSCLEKKHNYNFREDNTVSIQEALADFLLAHGVIVPPCKVGDTVYTNFAVSGDYLRKKDRPYECKVVFIGINTSDKFGGGFINVEYKNSRMMQFNFNTIGKTVFLTREEAEQALRECDNNA